MAPAEGFPCRGDSRIGPSFRPGALALAERVRRSTWQAEVKNREVWASEKANQLTRTELKQNENEARQAIILRRISLWGPWFLSSTLICSVATAVASLPGSHSRLIAPADQGHILPLPDDLSLRKYRGSTPKWGKGTASRLNFQKKNNHWVCRFLRVWRFLMKAQRKEKKHTQKNNNDFSGSPYQKKTTTPNSFPGSP